MSKLPFLVKNTGKNQFMDKTTKIIKKYNYYLNSMQIENSFLFAASLKNIWSFERTITKALNLKISKRVNLRHPIIFKNIMDNSHYLIFLWQKHN